MKAVVKRINGVRGFMPTTYAVYCGEYILKIFLSRKEAQTFADKYNEAN